MRRSYRHAWIQVLTCCLIAAPAVSQETELRTVMARRIRLDVPQAWKEVAVTTNARAAEFAIPGDDGGEGAELVVYYFGGPTGGVRANVERWIGQFYDQDRRVRLTAGTCRDGRFVLADIAGTWKKPDGPPFAARTIDKPNSRVIGVVLIEADSGDYYFVKLSGPDGLVARESKALRAAFAADAESEKPFDLSAAD